MSENWPKLMKKSLEIIENERENLIMGENVKKFKIHNEKMNKNWPKILKEKKWLKIIKN